MSKTSENQFRQALANQLAQGHSNSQELVHILESGLEHIPFFGDGMHQDFGFRRVDASCESLAKWLTNRARSVGSDQAVDDLMTFSGRGYFAETVSTYVDGVTIEGILDVSPDIRLIGAERLDLLPPKLSREVQSFCAQCRKNKYGENANPTLVVEYNSFSPLIRADVSKTLHNYARRNMRLDGNTTKFNFHDLRYILTLFSVRETRISGTVFKPSPRTALFGSGRQTTSGHEGMRKLGPTLIRNDQHAQLSDSILKWIALDSSEKDHFRLALERLRRFHPARNDLFDGARNSIQDQIIDLSIALEILLLQGIKDELTFRLRLRAAKLISTSTDEAIRISKDMKVFYEHRSMIVHQGKLPKGKQEKDLKGLRDTIFGYCVRIMFKLLGEPKTDFNRLELM